MSIKTKIPDLIQRPDLDIESDSESKSATQDTILPWTTNEIITQIGVTEAYEAPIQSDSEFNSNTIIPDLTQRIYSDFEDSESDEDEGTLDQEFYKISTSNQHSKEIHDAEILLTIQAVQYYPKRTILCLLDSGFSSSFLNKSKKRYKEVWDTQGGSFVTFIKTIISDLQLPQFTTHRNFEAEMHLFERKKGEKYDAKNPRTRTND